MTQRKLRVDHSGADTIEWRDAVNGEVVLTLHMPFSAYADETIRAALRYGCTQIVQDGGAVSAGASFGEKVAGMRARIAQLETGTYRLGQRGGMVDSDVFAAMIALGMITDTPDNRGKWRDAKKSQRDAIRRKPAIAQWIAENATDADAAESAVTNIFS